ncbi:atpC [Wigglesworthia glossinidia endosymbiont of Glossina brevipalpis]|uniref:ATP synthase epsilon chain n=1 Tax=Wigglesworthia glossinidia brevipalpis TaxID=36870 RepID=ATPE_WIGBR|nr:RecName: Full=ATP synthase epsilon chain; AltName: Full=ATP synthase F1 sector epsilon subunit; AltName: Full=F-ATPase epsilon subunit [Wigglesworthia glossinidia endosymbiont of Glossina brevipalpis]BAC24155.1 atpC [Wigglesworthia glossinidia endosymbiont of Glossina brevipalpis]
MNNKFYQLTVISAENFIFSNLVKKSNITGSEGNLGILPGHAPLITKIKPGLIHIISSKNIEEYIYLSGGILEINSNVVTVLADTAIRGKEIDEKKAIESKKNAEELILKSKERHEYIRAVIELSKAIAKLRVCKLSNK